jgi:hypothetical protein
MTVKKDTKMNSPKTITKSLAVLKVGKATRKLPIRTCKSKTEGKK